MKLLFLLIFTVALASCSEPTRTKDTGDDPKDPSDSVIHPHDPSDVPMMIHDSVLSLYNQVEWNTLGKHTWERLVTTEGKTLKNGMYMDRQFDSERRVDSYIADRIDASSLGLTQRTFRTIESLKNTYFDTLEFSVVRAPSHQSVKFDMYRFEEVVGSMDQDHYVQTYIRSMSLDSMVLESITADSAVFTQQLRGQGQLNYNSVSTYPSDRTVPDSPVTKDEFRLVSSDLPLKVKLILRRPQ